MSTTWRWYSPVFGIFDTEVQAMRLICSQCQTPFHVDDKYMTARGLRAQCPRCTHIELIPPASVATGTQAEEEAEAEAEAEEEASFSQEGEDLDFSDLQSELRELEDWEFLSVQKAPSVHCPSCGKLLMGLFDMCKFCRKESFKPEVPSSSKDMEPGGVVEGASEEGSFSASGRLTNPPSPPYALESHSAQAAEHFATREVFSLKRGIRFWLRWIFIGCGMAMFFVLLWLAVMGR